MDIIERIFDRLRLFDEPLIYVLIVVAFFCGFWLCPNLSDRGFSLLIGIFIALTAFIGVIYSKHKEYILKNREIKLQKVEDFSVNLFQWLELMDSLLVMTYILKKQSVKAMVQIEMFSSEYQKGREIMTKILTCKGRHLALIALHGDTIINNETKDLLKEMLEQQEKGMSDIAKLLKSNIKVGVDRHHASANSNFGKMRENAKTLMTKIKVH